MAENQRLLAVLIDADNNTQPALITAIIAAAKTQGKPIISRIYGDFSQDNLKNLRPVAAKHDIEIKHSYHASSGKNATDIALVIDAMDILYDGNVGGFCIVSSDSDFTHLARRIRRNGLIVIGIGKANPALIESYDKFIQLEALAASNPAVQQQSPPTPPKPKAVAAPPPAPKAVEPPKPAKVGQIPKAKLPITELDRFRAAYKQVNESVKNKDGWIPLSQLRGALDKLYPNDDPLRYKGTTRSQLKKVVEQMKADNPNVIETRRDKLTDYIRIK